MEKSKVIKQIWFGNSNSDHILGASENPEPIFDTNETEMSTNEIIGYDYDYEDYEGSEHNYDDTGAVHVLLFIFYPDHIQILSRFCPDFVQIFSRFFRNSFYPDQI